MFKKLREKISNWTKKVSKKSGEKVEKSIEQIELPQKFNVGLQKFEPDLEKLREKVEDVKKEHPKPGERGFFKKVTSRIKKIKISEKEFEIYEEELKMLLLENNVAFDVADKMVQDLKTRIIGKEFLRKEAESEIKDAFKEIIEEILIEPFDVIEKVRGKKEKPYVILFCGINGTGKTTTIAKVADFLKKKKLSCVLAASDTFRAASIEQIKEHGNRLGVRVIAHDYGTDPAAVGFDAINTPKKTGLIVS